MRSSSSHSTLLSLTVNSHERCCSETIDRGSRPRFVVRSRPPFVKIVDLLSLRGTALPCGCIDTTYQGRVCLSLEHPSLERARSGPQSNTAGQRHL